MERDGGSKLIKLIGNVQKLREGAHIYPIPQLAFVERRELHIETPSNVIYTAPAASSHYFTTVPAPPCLPSAHLHRLLLLRRLLLCLLSPRKHVADIFVPLRPNPQLRANQRLNALHNPRIPAHLLILVLPRTQHVLLTLVGEVLTLADQLAGRGRNIADVVCDGGLQLARILLDNWEAGVDAREARLAELVGTRQVRRQVGGRGREVGVQGRDEGGVGAVEEGDGLCTVRVVAIVGEGVVDDGVGLEVLGVC